MYIEYHINPLEGDRGGVYLARRGKSWETFEAVEESWRNSGGVTIREVGKEWHPGDIPDIRSKIWVSDGTSLIAVYSVVVGEGHCYFGLAYEK